MKDLEIWEGERKIGMERGREEKRKEDDHVRNEEGRKKIKEKKRLGGVR